MNRKLTFELKHKIFFIIGTIISIILGIVLHFAYDFTRKSFFIGLLAPVNESTWEHLKLVFLPITLFYICYILFFKIKNKKGKNIIAGYTFNAIILSMILITVLHGLYTLVFKNHSSIFSIILYILCMLISFYYMYINYTKSKTSHNKNGILKLYILFILFILFTIFPPKLNTFKDPITNTYGIFMLQ